MRLEPIDPKRFRWFLKPLAWYMKRHVGRVLKPYGVLAHRPAVYLGFSAVMASLEMTGVLDPKIKRLAALRAAQIVGCVF